MSQNETRTVATALVVHIVLFLVTVPLQPQLYKYFSLTANQALLAVTAVGLVGWVLLMVSRAMVAGILLGTFTALTSADSNTSFKCWLGFVAFTIWFLIWLVLVKRSTRPFSQ